MAEDKIVYRYTGGHEPDGRPSQWYEGVPAKDLTQAEYDVLDNESQVNVKASAFYEKAGTPPPPKQKAPAKKKPAVTPPAEPDATEPVASEDVEAVDGETESAEE